LFYLQDSRYVNVNSFIGVETDAAGNMKSFMYW